MRIYALWWQHKLKLKGTLVPSKLPQYYKDAEITLWLLNSQNSNNRRIFHTCSKQFAFQKITAQTFRVYSYQERAPAEALGQTERPSKAEKETRSQKGNDLPQSRCRSVAEPKRPRLPPQSSLVVSSGQETDAARGTPTSSRAPSSLMSAWGDKCWETRQVCTASLTQTNTPAWLAGRGKKTQTNPSDRLGLSDPLAALAQVLFRRGQSSAAPSQLSRRDLEIHTQSTYFSSFPKGQVGTTKSPLSKKAKKSQSILPLLLRAETTTFLPILALLNPETHVWLKPILQKGILSW